MDAVRVSFLKILFVVCTSSRHVLLSEWSPPPPQTSKKTEKEAARACRGCRYRFSCNARRIHLLFVRGSAGSYRRVLGDTFRVEAMAATCENAGALGELMRPLSVEHLGILVRCYALSPEVRVVEAASRLREAFSVVFSETVIADVFQSLETRWPALLGGAPLAGSSCLPECTLITPQVALCPDCGQTLDMNSPRRAYCFFLNVGWQQVRYRTASCPCCRSEFSSCWRKRTGARGQCVSCVAPSECAFVQIVGAPRENARAFIETRVLWLLRASLLRTRASFTGFVEMLADLHGATSDKGHDPARFQRHWLLFELLELLWQEAPETAQSISWPLDSGHDGATFRACLEAVFPILQSAFHRQHFLEHRCDKCAVPVVTLDAKYGLTCALCNHREGGAVRYPQIDCTLLFGCQELPDAGCQYCREHAPSGDARAPAALDCRILRHRDVDGVRSYKLDGSSTWKLRGDVSAATVREYEQSLALKSDRRKRRRGRAVARAAAPPEGDDVASEEADYFDAEEPALRKQAGDDNPCGIDKGLSLSRRRYGGLLVATLPCGRVCAQAALAGSESLTQVYALLSTLVSDPDRELRYVFYDNACALARYTRHELRRHRTETAGELADLTYVLDSFHEANHTACLDPLHAGYLPEVRRSQHRDLDGLNSQTAEQFFAWMDPFVRSVTNMAPYTFRCVVLVLAHWYNLRVCGDGPPRRRRRSSHTRARRSSAGDGDGTPSPPLQICLCRNPLGVGHWGAGKFHWRSCETNAVRPPCQVVSFHTLTEEVQVQPRAISWSGGDLGFLVKLPDGDRQLCRRCGQALQRSGWLP